MITTALTHLLNIQHPIIQAGMGSEAGPDLASAVSNAGGLGTLGTIATNPEEVAAAISTCRGLTPGAFSVNCVTFDSPFADEILDVVERAGVEIVTLSFGDFAPALARFKAAGRTVIVQAQDIAAARRALEGGADAVIAQGNEAGGHTGTRGTLSFAAQVLRAAGEVPVVVAGGVADGRGLAAALAMGAAGVVMGTRFKASVEFAGQQHHKDAIARSDGSDTTDDFVTDAAYPLAWPAGVVGRVVRTAFIDHWDGRAMELKAKAESYDHPFGIFMDRSLDPGVDVNWAGESAGLVDEVLPAAEIVRRTVGEAEALLRRVPALLG